MATFAWEPSLGIFAWKPLLGNFTWEPSLGKFYLRTFTWETLLGNLYLGTFIWEAWGVLELLRSAPVCSETFTMAEDPKASAVGKKNMAKMMEE